MEETFFSQKMMKRSFGSSFLTSQGQNRTLEQISEHAITVSKSDWMDEDDDVSTTSSYSESESSCATQVKEFSTIVNLATKFHKVASVPVLQGLNREAEAEHPVAKRVKRSESECCFKTKFCKVLKNQSAKSSLKKLPEKPEDFLRSKLSRLGVDLDEMIVSDDSFLPIANQNHEDYPQSALVCRTEDLEGLRKLHQQGVNLQSCNKYGESIVHIICRRGNDALLEFLMEEANLSLRVKDDMGRTPVHDAAWTDKPNFDLIRRILTKEPDLLMVRDKRGFLALAYIPPNRWGLWLEFFDEHNHFFDEIVKSMQN